jgi:hypothetical protein
MTNHPNRSRTYWYASSRGFANEYSVGIATSKTHAEQYKAEGYDRISRDQALRDLSNRGDAATQIYAGVTVDGADGFDRFEVARAIRGGHPLPRSYY